MRTIPAGIVRIFLFSLAAPKILRLGKIKLTLASAPDFSYLYPTKIKLFPKTIHRTMKLFRRFTALMLAVTLSLTTFAAAARDWAAVEVADKAGATVKGIVYAGDEPLRGVAVSDGAEIVFTDAEGRYWLPTDKRSGSVFITIPSGYGGLGRQGCSPASGLRSKLPRRRSNGMISPLTKVDNDRHVMLAVTDIHLSNQNSDIEQFCTRFIPDVRAVAESFGDTPVYSLNMGDSAWDGYWYTNRYSLKDFRRTMNIVGYPAQMFCAMGNHDNDGATIHRLGRLGGFGALPPHHRAALLLVQHRQRYTTSYSTP